MHKDILNKVTRAIDTLIDISDKYEGLFPSLIDLDTHEMLTHEPTPIPGQRYGDRCHYGSNLIHDDTLLGAMYALDEPKYTQAADRYLKRFATHCTDTFTGLFPWGEHAFWHLIDDKIGNSSRYHDPKSTNPAIHDQLRAVPIWLWEKLHGFNPRCVERFAEGLEYHWKIDPPEYSRHGDIEVKERPENYDVCSFDFPRHGGFYIVDWIFAYLKTGRQDFLKQAKRMADYWPPHRLDDGLLPYCSRVEERVTGFYQVHAPGQTMGFASSLLDAAALVKEKEPEFAASMNEQALGYLESFMNAPHEPEKALFVLGFRPGVPERTSHLPIWGSSYGVWPASSMALLCISAYRHTGDERLLKWAEGVGLCYLAQEFPPEITTPAQDAGLSLGLLADLYDITGERVWLDGGLKLAGDLMDAFMDHDLPRGAAGINWYESQMGPSFLLHGLTRIALLADGRENFTLAADYTTR